MSNFLGEVGGMDAARPLTAIVSTAELMARERTDLRKGMNFRNNGELLSVFLVLPSHDGEYRDEWNTKKGIYEFEGHDSTTGSTPSNSSGQAGSPQAKEIRGKSKDQLLMYGDGKFTENGKFYKAANEFKDGVRKEPLQIQVYEKLEAGAWYDKGIFNLVAARAVTEGGRKIFKFDLKPADAGRADKDTEHLDERMLSATTKADIWQTGKGRCHTCKAQTGLRFVHKKLLCPKDRGESGGLLG